MRSWKLIATACSRQQTPLCETVSLGEVLELSDAEAGKDVLSLKKMAVHCMVELCQVRKYEVDMGKAISKRTNNAPENIRVTYGEKYDRLVQEIQAVDAGYEPEPIQREQWLPKRPTPAS